MTAEVQGSERRPISAPPAKAARAGPRRIWLSCAAHTFLRLKMVVQLQTRVGNHGVICLLLFDGAAVLLIFLKCVSRVLLLIGRRQAKVRRLFWVPPAESSDRAAEGRLLLGRAPVRL